MGRTSIEWVRDTDGTQGHSINPIRARLNGNVGHYCEKVSPGCKNCYSSRLQPRFRMPQFQEQRRHDVETFLDADKLSEVLKRRKPTTYFWCDMTDLFGDWVPNEVIAACFGVMAATPHHTHQVLTKRAKRMREWFEWVSAQRSDGDSVHPRIVTLAQALLTGVNVEDPTARQIVLGEAREWPLSNCWLGVSAEDQQRADERIPHLLATPAAVRFVSAEPLIGPIDFDRGLNFGVRLADGSRWFGSKPGIDWVIVGSESGPRARPMQIDWARSIVDQCRSDGVAVFTKQIANERDRKGGNPVHWPEGVWPREMPRAAQ